MEREFGEEYRRLRGRMERVESPMKSCEGGRVDEEVESPMTKARRGRNRR